MKYDPKAQSKQALESVNMRLRDLGPAFVPDRHIPEILERYLQAAYTQGEVDATNAVLRHTRERIEKSADTFGKMLANHLLSGDGIGKPR